MTKCQETSDASGIVRMMMSEEGECEFMTREIRRFTTSLLSHHRQSRSCPHVGLSPFSPVSPITTPMTSCPSLTRPSRRQSNYVNPVPAPRHSIIIPNNHFIGGKTMTDMLGSTLPRAIRSLSHSHTNFLASAEHPKNSHWFLVPVICNVLRSCSGQRTTTKRTL